MAADTARPAGWIGHAAAHGAGTRMTRLPKNEGSGAGTRFRVGLIPNPA